jgi:hypothetical protein
MAKQPSTGISVYLYPKRAVLTPRSIGWLEPLLSEIATNRRAVVCPIIDVLSDETFEYITGTRMDL